MKTSTVFESLKSSQGSKLFLTVLIVKLFSFRERLHRLRFQFLSEDSYKVKLNGPLQFHFVSWYRSSDYYTCPCFTGPISHTTPDFSFG